MKDLDPLKAFTIILERLDQLIAELKRIADVLEKEEAKS